MKKLICALIGAASLVASATTYIQTSTTGTAPWKPVKDSVSQAHLADSARKADSTRTAWKADSARIAWFAHAATYADSSRVSGLADSAKRAAWAPLDSVGVRGIVGDTATVLRSNMGDYIPLTGSGAIRGDLSPTASGQNIDLGSVGKEWTNVYATNGIFGGIETDLIYTKAVNLRGGNLFNGDSVSGWGFFGGAYRVYGGTQKGFLKADGSVDSSGAFAGVSDSSRASHIADTAKKSGTSGNSLALGGIAASQYGTLAQDTLIAKKVASDTATVLRAGIASAITTSEAYAIARISDSLTANTRAWTTLAAAKSSIHDSLTVERTFDTTASRSITHDTAAALRTYVGSASTTGNAATATKLATARTIGMSGDVTGTATAFDGTANITIPTTLPTLLTAGSAGSSTSVPTLTWDAKGRLTAAGSAAISIPHTQINDWATSVSSVYLPLTGGTLTGFLTGTSAELWTNKNAHDYGPALTLHGSIYTSDANLLLRSSAGYGNFVGFSDQSKSTGFQRWNLGVENDAFQIHANSSDGLGGESVLKLDRNGNLTIRGTLTAFSFTGNAATATKLATARTISITGDGTWSTSFDGSANATGALTLATLLTAGSAGSATTVPTLTWDAKGRLIAAGSAAISIPHAQISDWGTYINQALLTTSSPTFGNANIGTMIGYPNNSWFGYSGFNVGTNYSGFYQTNASDIGIAALSGHGVYLQVAQTQILDILGDGIIAHQPISANGGITGNLSGTASNASALGGVAEDYFVRGNGVNYGTRTTPLPNWSTGTSSSQQLLKTGAYDGNFPVSSDMPTGGWWLINHVKHSDPSGVGGAGYWGFDLAAGMGTGGSVAGQFCVRTSSDVSWGTWYTLLHSGNVGTFAIPLTGSSAITGSLVPQNASYYNLGTSALPWYSVYASTVYEAGLSLASRYAPIATPSYFSTNTERTLSSQAGSIYIYTVSQTTDQTLQDGTIAGETVTIKNAQNSSTLYIRGNVNAGSSVIQSLDTAILSWDGSKWY